MIVGTEAATAIITDPKDVSHYEERFAGYEALAVFGDEAREVLARLADEYGPALPPACGGCVPGRGCRVTVSPSSGSAGRSQIQLMMGEAALHKSVGTTGTLIGQLDRVMTMTALPSVDVGIVPFAVPMLPVPGFVIYDESVVTSESLTAEQRLIEPDEVAQYVHFFDELRAVAVTGRDAAALIQRVTAELRADLVG